MIKRNVWERCVTYLDRKEILLIVGARQVGKTTLLRELSDFVQSRNEQAFYFSLENPILLESLHENPENIFSYIPKNKRKKYLFLDEVQYLNNPSMVLKYLYDTYAETVKLVVSGSSAFYVDRSFRDSMAGRKRIIELYPFSFSEFLRAKGKSELAEKIAETNWINAQEKRNLLIPKREELYHYLYEYLKYGGYPAVVMEDDEEEKRFTLKDIHESFLKKDMLEAGISRQYEFYRLVKILADQSGSLFNANELGNTLGLSTETVRDYTYLLRKSFIFAEITPFHSNIRKELTKMPKLYMLDNGFRNIVLNDFRSIGERPDKGTVLETQLFIQLRTQGVEPLFYWRTQDKKEVDFIVPDAYALEVKWSASHFNPKKYNTFTEAYPDIPLFPVVFKDNEHPDLLDFVH